MQLNTDILADLDNEQKSQILMNAKIQHLQKAYALSVDMAILKRSAASADQLKQIASQYNALRHAIRVLDDELAVLSAERPSGPKIVKDDELAVNRREGAGDD